MADGLWTVKSTKDLTKSLMVAAETEREAEGPRDGEA